MSGHFVSSLRFCARAALCGAIAASVGCAQKIRIASEADPATNFRALRTYTWQAAGPHIVGDGVPPKTADRLDARIRTAVDAQLMSRWYGRIEIGEPDFQVDYRMRFFTRTADSVADYFWYRRLGGDSGLSEAFVFGYDEGVLMVELTDPTTGRVLWHATAEAVAGADADQTRINDFTRLMFERLP